MKLCDVKNSYDWRLYEGACWINAVRENGLNVNALPTDERWMMEQADTHNRATMNEQKP